MEPISDVGLDSDRLILAELRREAKARGFLVFTISEESFWLYATYLLGILVGAWLAGGDRG